MSEEEFFERAINRICKDYDGEFAFEFESIFKKKDKEIERLNNIINKVLFILEHLEDDRVGYEVCIELLKGSDKE